MKLISGYEVKSLVKEMGEVKIFEGQSIENNIPVLFKVIASISESNKYSVKRLKQENEFLNKLQAEPVPKSHGIHHSDQNLVLVMEKPNGITLKDFSEQNFFNLSQTLQAFRNTLIAVQKIHNKKIILNNIKPTEISMDTDSNEITLTDLGLASHQNDSTALLSQEIFQTMDWSYVSPEMTGRLNRIIDNRSDLYNLGLVFFELLSNTKAFPDEYTENPLTAIHYQLQVKPEFSRSKRTVPPLLQSICFKLLEKLPENRYQTIAGILHDIEKCEQSLKKHGVIKSFTLGMGDIDLSLPRFNVFIGRKLELQKLNDWIDNTFPYMSNVCNLKGKSGTGKTLLIQNFINDLRSKYDNVVYSKVDQGKQNIPYSPIVNALDSIIKGILILPEDEVKKWKTVILSELGSNSQLMVEILPRLATIIGTQTHPGSVLYEQAKIRFTKVFHDLINVITKTFKKSMLIFDDIQWADDATLQFLNHVIVEEPIKGLNVILASRSDLENKNEGFITFIEKLQNVKELTTIALDNWDSEIVVEYISKVINMPKDEVEALSKVLIDKTAGNPLFIKQFLADVILKEHLMYSDSSKSWAWDIGILTSMKSTDNVVDLLVDRLGRLPLVYLDILKWCSCLGNQFDLGTLSQVIKNSPSEIHHHLIELQELGFIQYANKGYDEISLDFQLSMDNDSKNQNKNFQYQFVHDRIQQSAYALISQEDKQKRHYQLGTILLDQNDETKNDLYTLLFHLNYLPPEIVKKPLLLVEMNLQAASRASLSNAYDSAFHFTQRAVQLVESHEIDSTMVTEVHMQHGESSYLLGNFEQAEISFQHADNLLINISNNSSSKNNDAKLQKLKLMNKKILMYAHLNNHDKAIDVSLTGLAIVNISIKKNQIGAMGKGLILYEMLRAVKQYYSFRKKNKEINKMEDEESIIVLQMMNNVLASAYLTSSELWAVLVLKMVQITFKKGFSEHSVMPLGCFGAILGSGLGWHNWGFELGQLGSKVINKYPSPVYKPRLLLCLGTILTHWKKPVSECLEQFYQSKESAIENGDNLYLAYSLHLIATIYLYQSVPLDKYHKKLIDYIQIGKKLKYGNPGRKFGIQMINNLQGKISDKFCIDSDDYDPDNEFSKILETGDSGEICLGYVSLMQALIIQGEYQKALTIVPNISEHEPAIFGQLLQIEYLFLSCLASMKCHNINAKHILPPKKINKIIKKFSSWNDACPNNFSPRYHLLFAEWNLNKGNNDLANQNFDKAIKHSIKENMYKVQALALESYAQHKLSSGETNYANYLAREASKVYSKWGASLKAKEVLEKFEINQPASTPANFLPANINPDKSKLDYLDLITLIQSTQRISQETAFDKLIESILSSVLLNSGSEKVSFIKNKDQHLILKASIISTNENYDLTLEDEELNESSSLPMGVIQYCKRSLDEVLLTEASTDEIFKNDPYVNQNNVQSLLCLPLLQQGQLIGILYLENTNTKAAFTEKRIEFLKILGTQAAISLQNSSFHEIQLEALQTKINPHFLFNSLNIIADLTHTDPALAEEAIIKLSKLYRFILTASESKWVTLNDELSVVKSYLMLEKLRFENRLTFEIDVQGDIEKVNIPGLCLQPLVENSVKHGISPRPEGGHIMIKVLAESNRCIIIISDNGIGVNNLNPGTGHSLKSIPARLALAYGENHNFLFKEKDGVTITIEIPV